MAAVEENILRVDEQQLMKRQEETHFRNLKSIIFETMIKRNDLDEDAILVANQDIKNSFKEPRRDQPGRDFASVDLSALENACAFVHRNGELGMSLTRFKVLQSIENLKDLKRIFEKPVVNVVCIGGGAGTDVVGLTSALHESEIRTALNITIVDSVKEWSEFAGLLEALIRDPKRDFGNCSLYFRQNNVNLSFIRAKLPFDAEDNQDITSARQAIGEADIIMMMRFIESVEKEMKYSAIQHVRENMKHGAIALVVDSPFYADNSMWAAFEHLYVQPWSDDPSDWFYVSASPSDSRFGEEAPRSKALLAVFRRDLQYENSGDIAQMA